MKWNGVVGISKIDYICDYCGKEVAPNEGIFSNQSPISYIAICPKCSNPTFLKNNGKMFTQFPAPAYGKEITFISDDKVKSLYNEVRQCFKVQAYTAIALLGRKILMHIAVEKGAKENLKFVEYVTYLVDTNWVPPNGKKLTDRIKEEGNAASHQIVIFDKPQAEILVKFIELLLTSVYGFEI